MIKIIFAPGCYGTFLTKCLYYFSNLNDNFDKVDFLFDANGSSHDFRSNKHKTSVIDCGHIETLDIDYSVDQVITLLPDSRNYLDYFDNQYIKQEIGHIIGFINSCFSAEETNKKIQTGWGQIENFNSNTPRWIIREWTSFWIDSCLTAAYNSDKYYKVPSLGYYHVSEIFDDLYLLIEKIVAMLGLTLTTPRHEIERIHHKFVQQQKMHNIQLRCQSWVNNIIQGNENTNSPCITIFDEAYVQMLLRKNGYEIQCNELDKFPTNSKGMIQIIYKTQ
jgi:hypothetical protein